MEDKKELQLNVNEEKVEADGLSGLRLDMNNVNVTPTTCSSCGENKIRISTGKTSPNGRRKYYIDEQGKVWRGKVCPRCSRMKHTKYMRKVKGVRVPNKYRDDMF